MPLSSGPQKSPDSPAAGMSSSGLHASFALAAAMPVLMLAMRIWFLLSGVLLVFQDGLPTFISLRIRRVVCRHLPTGRVFLRHSNSLPNGNAMPAATSVPF